jgi:hypothetical protein
MAWMHMIAAQGGCEGMEKFLAPYMRMLKATDMPSKGLADLVRDVGTGV